MAALDSGGSVASRDKRARYPGGKRGLRNFLGPIGVQSRSRWFDSRRRLHALLRREGIEVNHKRIFRLYQAAGLAVARHRSGCGVAIERSPVSPRRSQPPLRACNFTYRL